MKTISVKEAAEALGVSPRAVQYKLQNGDLKGTRNKNQYGVAEWRVWPTKDISEALTKKQGDKLRPATDALSFEPNDVIDAVSVEGSAAPDISSGSEQGPVTSEFQAIVEQCVRPLIEEVKTQALALAERDRIIEDQGRQLRLLPDLQKKAEKERQAAEVKTLETIALQKQIELLQAAKEAENQVLKAELEALKSEVERLTIPWWKRFMRSSQ